MFGSSDAIQADVKNLTYKTAWIRTRLDIIKNRLGESDQEFNRAYIEFGKLETTIKYSELKQKDVRSFLDQLNNVGQFTVDMLTEAENIYLKPISI